MSLPEINFASIRAHDGSRNAGFEELCCQLASLEPRPSSARFFRKGRGGDAGVECFIQSADGRETGWQAKYIFFWSDALAAQLDESIATALKRHPKLNRYIVCLPFDLPDARAGSGRTRLQRWENWRKKWITKGRTRAKKLQIELWGKSDLTQRLARDDPSYAGRLAYWFDQDNYTQKWFRHQFGKARAALGSRYTPETNVELPIRRDFLGFTRDPGLNLFLHTSNVKVQEGTHSANRAVINFSDKKAPWRDAFKDAFEAFVESFSSIPITPDQSFPISNWISRAARLQQVIREALDWVYKQPEKKDTERTGTHPKQWAQHSLFRASDAVSDFTGDLHSERWKLANHQAVLLTGEAGTGKSHLLADVVEHQIASAYPGILVLGSAFIDGEPWRQILAQLDLPSTLQIKQFLAAMDAAAQAVGVRAIICIDAINERNGIDVWPSRLSSFLKEAEPFSNVAIVLSCRSTFVPYVIPEGIPDTSLHRVHHAGFAGRASEAAKVYLDKRRIVRPGAPNLVPEFENPLFLKTCCDYLEKEGKHELPRGLTGVSQIFGFYADAITRALNQRMRLDPHAHVIPRAINALAGAIAEKGTGYIEKTNVITLFESIHLSNNSLEQSLLSQLESEGVITIEAVQLEDGARSDEIRFTFERFSDYQIANYLLDHHLDPNDVSSSFAADTPLNKVITGEEAYRRSGIIEALSVQLPERTNTELIDLFHAEEDRWVLYEPFHDSLLWRNQDRFTDRTYEILKTIAKAGELLEVLFTLATEPRNKFNARYLHQRLAAIPLAERDRSWTTFINQRGEDENSSISTLISWTLANGLEAIEDDRAELAGIALAWLLTASNREVRDKATKALACLLANRFSLAAKLIEQFVSIDDVYVFERLLAASYGGLLQGMTSKDLTELARAVYQSVFAGNEPPANLLLRDHASGIFWYIGWRQKLPSEIDLTKVRPPHRSVWPLEYVSDELIETYKQTYGKNEFADSIVSSAVRDGGLCEVPD